MEKDPAEHRFLRFVLPAKAFAAVKAGTKEWETACPCGHTQDYWDAGGVRAWASGTPTRLAFCPVCKKNTLQQVRLKTGVPEA